MKPQEFQDILNQTFEDRHLSKGERHALSEIIAEAAFNDQNRAVYRHMAFELAENKLPDPRDKDILQWLEGINKLLLPPTGDGQEPTFDAFFSPGERCTHEIIGLLGGCRATADLCVFTITDDRITRAIEAAFHRGVAIRVISDGSKSQDLGSDIDELWHEGIPVRLDDSPYFMHHKFAIFDDARLLTGSYNWTRSASDHNHENFVVTNSHKLVKAYRREFDRLWGSLA
jgi:cardiolipin hydrolase